jgi:hypothetical protein
MMHVVLGDGEMTRRELSKTLEDLVEQASEIPDDDEFWFLLQGKAEPTATDKALMDWIAERDIWYAVITDDKKGMDPIYKTAQETYEVKRLAPKVLSLMQEKPQEGEDAALFGLFVNNDADVPEDTWLNDVMASVVEGGYKIFSMNDGLVELGLPGGGDEDAEEEAEPDNVVEMTSKSKVPKPPPEEEEAPSGTPKRDELEDMNSEQLRALGATMGLEFPPRTRMTTMIKEILGEGGTEAEVEEVEVPDVPEDEDDLAEKPEEDVAVGNGVAVSSGALLVVIFNGTVISRAISAEEARDLVS